MGGANTTDLNIIRNRLRTTTSQVKGIVNLLKRKNSTVKQDLDRIKLLDRRLKRVIPIIPGMAGVAGSVFGRSQRGPESGGGLPGLGGLPGGIPTGPRGGRPPAPQPAPVPSREEVPEEEKTRETTPTEEVPAGPPIDLKKEQERIEQLQKIEKLLEEGKEKEAASEIEKYRKKYGETTGLPNIRPRPIRVPYGEEYYIDYSDPKFPGGIARTRPMDPGFVPISIQDDIEVLKELVEETGKGQVFTTPEGFMVIVDKNKRPTVYSPKQLNAQRDAIRNNPLANILVVSQALLDVYPGGKVKFRGIPRRNKNGQIIIPKPGSGSPRPPGLPRVVTYQQRVDKVRRQRYLERVRRRRKKAQEEFNKKKEQQQTPYYQDIERRRQEAERRREEAERKQREAEAAEAKGATIEPDTPDADRILGGAQTPRSKTPSVQPQQTKVPKEFGPDKLTGPEIQSTLDILSDPSVMTRGLAPEGTIANFLGLDRGSIRTQFLEYLTGGKFVDGTLTNQKLTRAGVPNYGFYEKVLRQIGLIKGSMPPKQVDDDVFRFLINYHKKFRMSPDKLIQDMLQYQMIDPSTTIGNPRMRAIIDEAIKGGAKPGDVFTAPPQLKPFGEQYQYEDLQSLNIDTSGDTQIVIVLTGPKPANA